MHCLHNSYSPCITTSDQEFDCWRIYVFPICWLLVGIASKLFWGLLRQLCYTDRQYRLVSTELFPAGLVLLVCCNPWT